MTTLSQLKEKIDELIEDQGKDSPVAAFIYTKKDVVTVVNGAVANEDGDHICLEDETSAGDHLTGDKIVFESGTGTGDITDIYLTNGGDGYKSLPTVSVTSTLGSGASVLAYGTEIGKVLGITTSNLGINYHQSPTPPTLSFVNNLFVMTVSGSFLNGETVTGAISGATGLVSGWSSDTNILKLKEISYIHSTILNFKNIKGRK